MPGPSTYDDEIRSSMQPYDDGKGFKSYVDELGSVLTAPNADMRPQGIAGSILRQLLGQQDALTNREQGNTPQNIPLMPRFKFGSQATDIPGSGMYSDQFNIPSNAGEQGLDGMRRIIEQLIGQQGGGRL